MSRSPQAHTENPASEDDVPARLVSTAIALYGARGTQAVSAREIQRRAGVLNEAAVRYYFGDRMGLIGACLARISAAYAPISGDAWSEYAALKQAGPTTVTDAIRAFVYSFHALLLAEPDGVALLARMIREEGEAGQALLIEHFGDMIWRLEEELRALLPDKSADALRLHVFLAINNTVNGMVDQDLLWRLPATRAGQARFQLGPDKLAEGFIEYVAAGVSAPSQI